MDKPTSKQIFVVQHYLCGSIMCILQLETPVNNLMNRDPAHMTLRRIEKRHLQSNDCVECIDFNTYQPRANTYHWLFSRPTSPNSFMYIVPKHKDVKPKDGFEFPGFMYDIKTREKQEIKSLPDPKSGGHVVSCKGQAYFLAHPDSVYPESHNTFESYNPAQGKWKRLEPFPDHFGRLIGLIKATAVWDDTILYNMDLAFQFWAYNVVKDKWYLVEVIDGDRHSHFNRCYTIVGEAVVVKNTIYALSAHDPDAILEMCIERKNIDDDSAYKCTLVSMIIVPGLKPVGYDHDNTAMWSRHLAYLDDYNFCIVQSCYYFMSKDFQPLQLTSIERVEEKEMEKTEMGEKSMTALTVTGTCLYEVFYAIHGPQDLFYVGLCFSLPEYKSLKPVQVLTRGGAAAKRTDEGHYIYVRNLPHESTKEELLKKLKKFGPIKRDGIWVNKNGTGAWVEFESETSKLRAIEASTIIIGGGCAEIKRQQPPPAPSIF